MSDLVSFGGDGKVVATRSEIDRITGELASVQNRLVDELAPLAQFHGLIHHIQLDVYLPEVLVRLGLQRHGCYVAGERFYTEDAKLAHHFNVVGEFLADNQWLTRSIPRQVWGAIAVGTVGAGFTNTDLTALGLRFGQPLLPVDTAGQVISALPAGQLTLVEQQPRNQGDPPSSVAALSQRLNNTDGNIRIERYETATGKVAIVYLPGTGDWNPIGQKTAFDIRSDMEMAAGKNSMSIEAAKAAINSIGLTADEKLVLVGYSQGGMVAAELAGSNSNVVGVVTIGSPVADYEIPNRVPTISIEHSNDVVPALSGQTNPFTENWVTASRHLDVDFGETVLKAHEMGQYQHTAEMVDKSNDVGVRNVRSQILRNFAGARPLEVREFSPTRAAS